MEKNSDISIKQNLIPTIKQKIQFNYEKDNSLLILKMNNTELLYRLRSVLFGKKARIKAYIKNEYEEHEWYKIDNSLQSELRFQYRLSSLNIEDKYAYFIIDSLDDNGFLTMSDEEYCSHLKIDQNEFTRILNELQKMEPIGIFAKNSIDSIKIQLQQDEQYFALDIFTNHSKELIEKDYSSLATIYQCTVDEIMDAVNVIKEQTPFPATQYGSNTSLEEAIIPDVEIKAENEKVIVHAIDPIKDIFEDYTSQINSDDLLKEYFQQANILIEDITKKSNELIDLRSKYQRLQDTNKINEFKIIELENENAKLNESIDLKESDVSETVDLELISENKPANVEEALAIKTDNGTLNDDIIATTQKTGEKVSLRRFAVVEKDDGDSFGAYLHQGGQIAALVVLEGADEVTAKDVAMHVAAINPEFMTRDDVSQDRLDHERAIFKEETLNEGKPAKIVDKIVEGRLNKFLSQICLADQEFVKDSDKTVAEYVKDNGGKLKSFIRYEVGEGIEKKQDDFAQEVKDQMN